MKHMHVYCVQYAYQGKHYFRVFSADRSITQDHYKTYLDWLGVPQHLTEFLCLGSLPTCSVSFLFPESARSEILETIQYDFVLDDEDVDTYLAYARDLIRLESQRPVFHPKSYRPSQYPPLLLNSDEDTFTILHLSTGHRIQDDGFWSSLLDTQVFPQISICSSLVLKNTSISWRRPNIVLESWVTKKQRDCLLEVLKDPHVSLEHAYGLFTADKHSLTRLPHLQLP